MSNMCTNLCAGSEQTASAATPEDACEERRFTVGVMGEMKRGKSTVVNALLGQEIMPVDIVPCTTVPVRVTYGAELRGELRMRDGSVQQIRVEELPDCVTETARECRGRAACVEEAVVYCPCPICRDGIDIVDTPGLNCDDRMNRICKGVIPRLDAVVMVIVPGSPFSENEQTFVSSKLLSFYPDRLIFLVNRIYTVRELEDRALVEEAIRKRILRETQKIIPYDRDAFPDGERNSGIFFASAIEALEGIQSGDQMRVARSGLEPFASALRAQAENRRSQRKSIR